MLLPDTRRVASRTAHCRPHSAYHADLAHNTGEIMTSQPREIIASHPGIHRRRASFSRRRGHLYKDIHLPILVLFLLLLLLHKDIHRFAAFISVLLLTTAINDTGD